MPAQCTTEAGLKWRSVSEVRPCWRSRTFGSKRLVAPASARAATQARVSSLLPAESTHFDLRLVLFCSRRLILNSDRPGRVALQLANSTVDKSQTLASGRLVASSK